MSTVPIATIPVALVSDADIADIDVHDPVVVSDTLESVQLSGGALGHRTLLVTGPDLVVAADELRRLADRITDVVLDARQARLDEEMHDCWCGTRLEPDEITCGALRCNRAEEQDRMGLIP